MGLRLWGDYRKVIGLAESFYSNRLKLTDTRLMAKSVEKPRVNGSSELVVPFFPMRTKPSAANCSAYPAPGTPSQTNPHREVRACVLYHARM